MKNPESQHLLPEQPTGEKPFVVPEGYFDSLSEAILNRIALQEGSPVRSEESFKVPDGYFDSLSVAINERVHAQPKVIPLFGAGLRASLAIAAVTIAGLLVHSSIVPDANLSSGPYSQLTVQEIQNSPFWEDLDESLLAESFTLETSSNDDVVLEYLIDQGIEPQQIDIEL
ncbi:MAG: hypothetical protein ACKO1U_10010 [Bacteroidota bacterium]